MSVEQFKIAALPVDVSKLLTNTPLGGALAGAGIGGLTSLLSSDEHPLRDMAVGAGAGGLHGRLGQQANVLGQQAGQLESRMGDVERTLAARRAVPASSATPAAGGFMRMLGDLLGGRKNASFASIFPAVAAPALGSFAGRAIGAKFKQPDLGMLLGGITGGTTGQLLKEKVEEAEDATVPPGAPYNLDATSQDIPSWALQGAHLLQPRMKQSAHAHGREPIGDVLKGEIPGYPVAEALVKHGPEAGARTFGGMAGGGLVGGGLGALGAYGIEKLLGHQVNVPGIGMSLPDLLASVGGTIGATKGLRYMKA
jgi:hypothetical protein